MLLAASLGCDEDQGLPSEQLLEAEVEARCSYMVRCGFVPDRSRCLAVSEPDQDLVQALGAIAFGRTSYDAVAAQEWISAVTDRPCDGTLAVEGEVGDARLAVFAGTVAAGGGCFSDSECSGDSICDRLMCPGDLQCCIGECVSNQPLPEGERCSLETTPQHHTPDCDDTTYCRAPEVEMGAMPPSAGVCTLRVDNGMACTEHQGCFDGQRCDGTPGNPGTCYKLSGDGEHCNPNLPAGACVRVDQGCDAGSSTCVTLPGAGRACLQGRCLDSAVCVEDMCQARPAFGQACDGSLPCLGDLRCREGTCQPAKTVIVCVEGQEPPPPMAG